jgi:hypothetical protein
MRSDLVGRRSSRNPSRHEGLVGRLEECALAAPPQCHGSTHCCTCRAWGAHIHIPGTSYDNNRFGAVLELDERILGFDINLPPNTPIETARAAARHELPPDTTVVWSKTLAECEVEQLHSATLKAVLTPPLTLDGVQVEYESPGLGDAFDAHNVRGVILILGNTDPADTTVC